MRAFPPSLPAAFRQKPAVLSIPDRHWYWPDCSRHHPGSSSADSGILQRTLDQTGSAKCIFYSPSGQIECHRQPLLFLARFSASLDPLFYAAVVNAVDHLFLPALHKDLRLMHHPGIHPPRSHRHEICIFVTVIEDSLSPGPVRNGMMCIHSTCRPSPFRRFFHVVQQHFRISDRSFRPGQQMAHENRIQLIGNRDVTGS